VPDRYLPDKAIDAIDEAASRVRLYKVPYIGSLREAFANLKAVRQEKEEAIAGQRFEDAADLRDRELDLQGQLQQMRMGWQEMEEKPQVSAGDVAEVISMWTGVPVQQIAGEESERLLHMEEGLHSRVVGQDEAIEAISKAVRRARAGLKDPRRPIGTFVFLGPTGVGKTELAKALAEFMFGNEEALVKLDMSEFMERHNVARLVGSPPGYVGYEEGGQLTEAIRRRPYSVVLFDEIEKAHPEAFSMLLQIMEDGHLSDAKGKRVDFRNCILILTSNVGAEMLNRVAALGFNRPRDEASDAEAEYKDMRDKVLAELKRTFRPEFLNRLDGVMVFRPLTREQIKEIVRLELNKVRKRLVEQRVKLLVTEEAEDFLAREGYDPSFGARPLRRTIQRLIEDALSEGLLANQFHPGDTIQADLGDDGKIAFEVIEREELAPEADQLEPVM
jgi:ATP-dependent Clp protease ATP-binding subunit ClpC